MVAEPSAAADGEGRVHLRGTFPERNPLRNYTHSLLLTLQPIARHGLSEFETLSVAAFRTKYVSNSALLG